MVQIIPMERAPTLGQTIGAGLGQGLGQGLTASIQEMMQEKKYDRENASLLKSMGREDLIDKVKGLPPQYTLAVLEHQAQYGAQKGYNDLASKLGGVQRGEPTSNQASLQESLMGQTQPYQERSLQPGEGMMLPQEEMPAEGEMNAPMARQSQETREMAEPSQMKPAQKLAELDRIFSEEYPNIQGEKPRKQAMQLYNQTRNAIINEGKLTEQTRKTDIAEQVAKKELQELPKQVGDKLAKFEDMATRADQSINAIGNIDSLLAQGAQMPEIVTQLNLKLGPDNILSRFATNLASSEFAKAVETARVQQFTGMKDIFGGQIRIAEFNEFIKKLQDVRDPVVSNKIKSVLLKQFANMEKFPYEGLSRAVEENPQAPSHVLMKKGKEYSDKMSKDYAKESKSQMDQILKEYKGQEAGEKGFIRVVSPSGVVGKVKRSDYKQALDKGYKKQ
jgi:hypothetical protein